MKRSAAFRAIPAVERVLQALGPLDLPRPSVTQAVRDELVAKYFPNGATALDDGRTVEQLKAELISRVGRNPELKLAISADKAAPIGQMVKVMDAAKEANIKAVNMFTKEAAK